MQIDFHRKWIVYGAAGVPAYIDPTAAVPAQLFFRDSGITNEGVSLWNGEVLDWLFDGDQLDQYAKYFLPRLTTEGWKNFDIWQIKAQEFQELQDQVMRADLKTVKDEDLFSLMQEYFSAFTEQYALNNWIEPVSYYFQTSLQGLLEQAGLDQNQSKQAIQDFGHPTKKSYVKLCVAEYQQAKTPEQVQAVLATYYYVKNDYTGVHPLTEQGIKEVSAEQALHVPPNVSHFSSEAQALLQALQITATVQDLRKEYILKWISGADKLLVTLSRRVHLEPAQLRFCTWTELMHNHIPTESELKQRMKRCVVNWTSRGTEVVSGPQADQLYTDFKQVVIGVGEVKQLKGMSASTGKVTGRAVVVLHPDQFNQVQPGDILVTVMTRPEYLPVMNKAAAFVTDEGGITSHAAIVAREMKKPCIIATKKGSKVIQTGQQIEVDATTGTVTIL